MEEYVPANNPINSAIEKFRIPSAPNINNATTTKITVRTVFTDRPNVCLNDLLTIVASSSSVVIAGSELGSMTLTFDTYGVPDMFVVEFDSVIVINKNFFFTI